MNIINIKDLIFILPDLCNMFLSGFIFLCVYNWLNNKDMNISLLTIWSLFISILIRAFYSNLHLIFLTNTKISDSIKIMVYAATGFSLAIICTYIKRTKLFEWILLKINRKSVNNDIFDDIFDYNKRTMLMVFLKSSDVYYIGRLSFREENGINSWISLVDYCRMSKDSSSPVFCPSDKNTPSSVAINFKDIERIEIIYEDDSERDNVKIYVI